MQEFPPLQAEIERVRNLPLFDYHQLDGDSRGELRFCVQTKGYKSTLGKFFDDDPFYYFRKTMLNKEGGLDDNYYAIKRVGTDSEVALVYFVVLDQGKEIGHLTHVQVKELYDNMMRQDFPEYYR